MTAPAKPTRGPSAAMLRALDRVRRGESARSAGKAEGLSPNSIYHSRLYLELQAAKAAKGNT